MREFSEQNRSDSETRRQPKLYIFVISPHLKLNPFSCEVFDNVRCLAVDEKSEYIC